MKSINIGLVTLALVTGIGTSLISEATANEKQFVGLYWYLVDQNQKTIGSPVYSNETKAQILAEPAGVCDDSGIQICMFGSTSNNLPTGTSAAGADSDHRINDPAQ